MLLIGTAGVGYYLYGSKGFGVYAMVLTSAISLVSLVRPQNVRIRSRVRRTFCLLHMHSDFLRIDLPRNIPGVSNSLFLLLRHDGREGI